VKRLCLVASLLAAAAFGSTAAVAQDRWPFNGLYVGLHAGYSWQDASGVFEGATPLPTSLSGLDLNGGILGAQLGYNAQYNWFMVGIEGDATAHPDDNSVVSPTGILLTGDDSYLASIRGRIGVVFYDWLLFGTAGVGFSEAKFRESTPGMTFSGTLRQKETGAVYGGGVEWAFVHGVTVRAEYLHYDVGSSTAIPTTFAPATAGDYVAFSDIDVARMALNISLNP
jgi:outer membrane immunogenic protein